MSQWLTFEQAGHTGKTAIVRVLSKQYGTLLGTIRWYGGWRQYAFYPADMTLFSSGCLEDIQAIIRDLTAARADTRV